MALATKCPHCGTVFKVAADQLKLRGGIVRCGKCNEIFDGNAALVDPEAAIQRAPLPESEATESTPAEAAPVAEAADEETPVYTLDFDTSSDPLGIIPKADADEVPESAVHDEAEAEDNEPVPQLDIDFDLELAPPAAPEPEAEPELVQEPAQEPVHDAEPVAEPVPEPEPESEPEPEPEPELGPEIDFVIEPEPEPEAEPEPSSETSVIPAHAETHTDLDEEPVSPLATETEAEAAELVPGMMAAETIHAEEPSYVADDQDAEEPGFVTRVRRKEKTTRIVRALMAVGCGLLLAGLLAQGVITFGSVLAARYPQAKPVLIEACKVLRCQVTLPAQIDALAVETGELQKIGEDSFLFATVLRNQASLVQTWPHIELALTDTADKTLVRRVITPAEYLPPRTDARKGFAAKSEQAVKVYFKLRQVTASGYHIAIFYP